MSSSSEGDKPTIDEKNLQTTSKKQVKQLFGSDVLLIPSRTPNVSPKHKTVEGQVVRARSLTRSTLEG
jgi:hypothetical protein